MNYSVGIIGTGNLAHHLAPSLNKLSMLSIDYIVSRDFDHAKRMAAILSAKPLTEIEEIPQSTDIIIIWTNDDAITTISNKLKLHLSSQTIIIHSSGLKSMEAIDQYFSHKGILWPIQSFSKKDNLLNVSEIPFCIMASNNEVNDLLTKIAKELSNHVYELNVHQKAMLHLTAIMSNNFVNHLFHISKTLLDKTDIPFEILFPLIRKTVEKIEMMEPGDAQSGPAIREDEATMDAHLALLGKDESLKNIYQALSKSIINYKRK